MALVASSSWSHAFLTDKTWHITPDTDADRRLYQLFIDRDYTTWQATVSREIVDSGQHEMLNWFCLTGAVGDSAWTSSGQSSSPPMSSTPTSVLP